MTQISPAVYLEYFEKWLSQGKDILSLCFSSGMSSTWQNAYICAEELKEKYPERKIICVDTLCASTGEGFLVYEAAKKRQSGVEIEDVTSWVEEVKLSVCHWFTVDTLEYL